MAVAANNGHSRLGESQFRADHMHDPLVGIIESVKPDAVFLGIFGELIYLGARQHVVNGQMLVHRGYVMIGCGNRFFRPENLGSLFYPDRQMPADWLPHGSGACRYTIRWDRP